MNKFVCSTFVFGEYVNYIPLYIWSILSEYPEYFVRVFLKDNLPSEVKNILRVISRDVSSRFEVIENKFSSMPNEKYCRWLLGKECFEDFEYAWISDVDFIILRESPSLLDFHLEHCRKFDIPYSNFVRCPIKYPHLEGFPKRVSGCHFVKVAPYFEKVEPYLKKIVGQEEDVCTRGSMKEQTWGTKVWDNEHFLYTLLKETHGIDDSVYNQSVNDFAHHHGIHLGVLRSSIKKHSNTPNSIFWSQRAKDIQLKLQDPLFWYIYENTKGNVKATLNNLVVTFCDTSRSFRVTRKMYNKVVKISRFISHLT